MLLVLLPPHPAAAQGGSVSGRLMILERGSSRTDDLADAVVYLESRATSPAPARATTQIVMESKRFIPHVRVMPVGGAVEFPNSDPFRHNVFSKAGPGEFDLGLYGRGESRVAEVRRAGVYPIFCNIHSTMIAYIVGVATRHYTQPESDGSYRLEGVPPGSYTLRVWHERGGARSREVEIGAGGASGLDVQLDARGYRFVQHRNKFGQEYSPAGRDRY
jgi:plastocyanin